MTYETPHVCVYVYIYILLIYTYIFIINCRYHGYNFLSDHALMPLRLCGSSLSQQGALVAEASYVQLLFRQLERRDLGHGGHGQGE